MPTPAEVKAHRKDKETFINQLRFNFELVASVMPDHVKEQAEAEGWDKVIDAYRGLPVELEPDIIETLKRKGLNITDKGSIIVDLPNGKAAYSIFRSYDIIQEAEHAFPAPMSIGTVPNLKTVVQQKTHVPDMDREGRYRRRDSILLNIQDQIKMHEGNIAEAERVEKYELVPIFQREIENLIKERIKVEATNYDYLEARRHILQDLKNNPLLVLARPNMTDEELFTFGQNLIAFNLLDYPRKDVKDIRAFEALLQLIIKLKETTPEGINPVTNRLNYLTGTLTNVETSVKLRFYSDRKGGLRKPKNKAEERILEQSNNETKRIIDEMGTIRDNAEFINQLLKPKSQQPEPDREPTRKPVTNPVPAKHKELSIDIET